MPSRTRSRERRLDALPVRLEACGSRSLLVAAEDLEVDDARRPSSCQRERCGAGEARVADRRDARAEALGRSEPSDRDVVVPAEPRLSRDVVGEPLAKAKTVAEAAVDRVLEVAMRVDEAGEDDAPGVVSPAPSSSAGPTAAMQPILYGDGAVRDRWALDGRTQSAE